MDILPIRKEDFVEVSLKGNLKFILKVVSEKKKIDCGKLRKDRSLCRLCNPHEFEFGEYMGS